MRYNTANRSFPTLSIVGCVLLLIVSVLASASFHHVAAQKDSGAPAGERRVHGVVRRLGSEEPMAAFTMIALIDTGKRFERRIVRTDEKGRYELKVPGNTNVRFYATGDFVLPRAWSRLPERPAGDSADQAHDLRIRPLALVSLSGRALLADDKPAANAQVYAAPLEPGADGSYQVADSPLLIHCGIDGAFRAEIAVGSWQIWAYWADRTPEVWIGHLALERHMNVFESKTLILKLARGPDIRGEVIDAADGKPAAAALDLYTNSYLYQRPIFTGDGSDWNKKPLGVFEEQAWKIDPKAFDVVVRPILDRRVMRILTDMSVTKLNALKRISLRSPAHGHVRLRVITRDMELPLTPTDVSISPTGSVDAPLSLRREIELSGDTDADGTVDFWGLPSGRYGVYIQGGAVLLKEIDVTGGEQSESVSFRLPFIKGKLTYPDGTPCAVAEARVEFELEDGFQGRKIWNAFRNTALAKDGLYFIPFHWEDSWLAAKYRLTFGAPAPGAAEVDARADIEEMAYISETIEITPLEHKGFERDVKLALNPDARKEKEDDNED